MSYEKMMRWHKKHPKGTRQPVIMHTDSGFWPSHSYIEGDYLPYVAACEKIGVTPLKCEEHYKLSLRDCTLSGMTSEEAAEWTRLHAEEKHEDIGGK